MPKWRSVQCRQRRSQPVVPSKHWGTFVVNVLAASSIGALNEIVEFLAVILLGSEGVGDYTNTAIDLVANLIGAIVGTLFMHARREPVQP